MQIKYSPGSVLSIRYPLYKHFAIVSDQSTNGKPNLISLSYRTGTVCEEAWDTVVDGRPIEPSSIMGNYSSELILKRTRQYIQNNLRYSLLKFNCEHFVRLAHGLPVESKQVQRTITGAIFGAGSCLILPNVTVARFAFLTSMGAISSLKSSLNNV